MRLQKFPSEDGCRLKSAVSYISFGVTAMRARTMSSGYVSMAAVMPASEPARSLGTGGRALQQRGEEYKFEIPKKMLVHIMQKGGVLLVAIYTLTYIALQV